jgi:hypothetical protein
MTIDPDNDEYPYSQSTRIQLNNEFKSLQFVYQGVRIYETKELVLDKGYYNDPLELYSSKDSISCWLTSSIGTNSDGSKYLYIEYKSQQELSGLKVVYKTIGYKTIGEEFIPDTIARKQELTELSEEVSGLSERIDNLPTAEDEILVVEYGKTTFQEVHDAYYAGKYIIFEFANNVFHINRVTASDIYFISVNGTIVYRIGLNNENNWYQNTFQNEQSTNKVTTLSKSSTDTQYPSAKAVYDALQNVGGGSDVFEAVYNETTYDEIVEARNAGKMVICVYNQLIYKLIRLTADRAGFSVTEGNTLYQVFCPKEGSWIRDNVSLTHKLETLDNGNAQITIAGKTAEVATPQYVENAIQQSGGGVSNEWKCVFDGRMEVGANEWVFSTYADGTPLKAEEVVVQVIMDNDTTKTTQGYVRVQSSTNKDETYYGAFFIENPNNNGFIAMSQVRLKASPFIMVAEIYDNLPLKVAQGVNCVGRLGKDVYQIYEDITLVRISATTKIAEAAPLLKIYAR